jgi:hypothetical protein
MSMSDPEAAVEAFDQALASATPKSLGFDKTETLILRGMARKKAGITGFASDWQEAAIMGSSKAEELLQTHK